MASTEPAAVKAGKRQHKDITPSEDAAEAPAVEEKPMVLGPISPIAQPRAGDKLQKKVYKAVKKAAAAKRLRRGVKECVKAVRKGEKGVVILAADISPVDVISHIPVMCEDAEIPYVYVESKAQLGAASSTKRPTSVVLLVTSVKGAAVPAYDGDERVAAVVSEVQSMSTA